MVNERYIRNIPAISEEEQLLLSKKCVGIVGLGGLGGYIAEQLARMGIGKLVLIDSDTFSESNLNRQLLCTEKNIGKGKSEEAAQRIRLVNSSVDTIAVNEKLDSENAVKLLDGCDIVLDALDNIEARLFAEHACERLGIYFIHAAISGWDAQVCAVAPGSRLIEKIYQGKCDCDIPSVLSFTAGFAASIEVSEATKILLSKESSLDDKLLIADLKENEISTIAL